MGIALPYRLGRGAREAVGLKAVRYNTAVGVTLSSLESELGSPLVKLRFADVKLLYTLVSALADTLEEASMKVSKDGIEIYGMDPAKVAYVEVKIPYSAFLEYKVDQDIELGLQLPSVERALSISRKGYTALLEATQDKVLIGIEGAVRRTYLLPNIQVSAERLEVKLEHDAHVKLLGDPLRRAVEDASQFGDVVEFEATATYFAVRASGERKAEARFLSGSASLLEISVNSDVVKSTYDAGYLGKIMDLARFTESVSLDFKADSPLEVTMESPSGISLRYVLAPSAAGAPVPAEEGGRGRARRRREEESEESGEEEESEESEESEEE